MTHWYDGGWLKEARRLASPNFGERPPDSKISLVVIHNISLPPGEFGGDWVEAFFLNQLAPGAHPYFAEIASLQVSAHFYVRRDGRIVQFVDCDKRAWHAGRSSWKGRDNCNDHSIGIELEGDDAQAFDPLQYRALWRVLEALCQRYPITDIAGHSDIAPGRKTDPGAHFDWQAVHEHFPALAPPARKLR